MPSLDESQDPDAQDTRWLTAEERAAWLGLNGVLLKLPGLLDAQLQRDRGLTFFEYMVLAMLAEQPDHQERMSRLAVLTSGSLSRLSHVAKRLEQQGLITRSTHEADRRSTNAQLTAEGLAAVTAAAPGHVAAVRQLVFDALNPEQIEALTLITDRMLSRIDPEGSTRPATP
ncbi:MarR family winged helix-turn-helix transcriptional regulator [Gephyromycinifex aptenodytis]|uniref:MarR family winged helix-turn-helix transcriptional regulator n=1 Tax=Gephyromycinifex aptenodytis TaxID=2716227 RepID=UPI0014460ABE|nr:MarR family transcriptional regulator [Gephyromycinifex aptenodytis]